MSRLSRYSIARTVLPGMLTLALIFTGTTHVRTQSSGDAGIVMLISSDPQLTWYRGGNLSGVFNGCDDDCVSLHGQNTNDEMAGSMNAIAELGAWPQTLTRNAGAPMTWPPAGLIINGDLTRFSKAENWPLYKRYWGAAGEFSAAVPVFPGLGNHDYSNNVDDCEFDLLYHPDKNRCAKEAVWWMANMIDHGISHVARKDVTGFVAVKNDGGYVARFTVNYEDGLGNKYSDTSDAFPAGLRRAVVIPRWAEHITADLQFNTVIGWSTISTRSIAAPGAACFKVGGTIANTSSDTDGCPHEWPTGSSGSLAYSFDIGSYHFVQLQYSPSYVRKLGKTTLDFDAAALAYDPLESPGFQITSAYEWLNEDLALATLAGQHIVINMHDATETESNDGVLAIDQDPQFLDALHNKNVVAIFAGHVHQNYGLMTTRVVQRIVTSFQTIPVFLSGSSECERFLLADFHDTYFNLGVVAAGTPLRWVTGPDACEPNWQMPVNPDGGTDGPNYGVNEGDPTPRTYVFNHPPTTTVAAPSTYDTVEGGLVRFDAVATDPDNDVLRYDWNFGDGTTASFTTPFTFHRYADNGTYKVTVTADDGHGGTGPFELLQPITVANAAPKVTADAPSGPIKEGETATITGTIFDAGLRDSLVLKVTWPDGTVEAQNFAAQAQDFPHAQAFSATHQFLDDSPSGTPGDDEPVTITVTDKDGGVGQASVTVSVVNVNPEASIVALTDLEGHPFDDQNMAMDGVPVVIQEHYHDAGPLDTLTATRNWGDGSATEAVGSVTTSSTGTHVYARPGTFQIALTVTDDDTGVGVATRTITVVDSIPHALSTLLADSTASPPAHLAIEQASRLLEGPNTQRPGAVAVLDDAVTVPVLAKVESALRALERAHEADPALGVDRLEQRIIMRAMDAVEAVLQSMATAQANGKAGRLADARALFARAQALVSEGQYVDAAAALKGALAAALHPA